MRFSLQLALRYLGSKKRAFISVGTAFAVLGVALGVAALVTVMSVTGGFQAQFRDKVLGVNAHVLVLKYSTDFREYRDIMEKVEAQPGVVGVAPFSINPMMLTHGDATATGVLLKGVDPKLSLGVGAEAGTTPVLDLPQHIIEGELDGLRIPGTKPATRPSDEKKPLQPDDKMGGETGALDGVGGGPAQLRQQIAKQIDEVDLDDDAELPTTPLTEEVLEAEGAESDEPAEGLAADEQDEPADDGDGEDADDGSDTEEIVGSTVPDGGFKSVLPDDDFLPEDVDTDECADPELVAKLPGIVVGVSLAKALDIWIGDCVTVTSPTIGFTFSEGAIKPPVAKRFRVISVFEAGFDQYDSKLVYTDIYEAQAFYDHGDTVTGVEMKVDDIENAGEIADQIGQSLPKGLYHTMDWMELNHGLFTALRIQQIGMSAVLALIIVVAAFTVVATLIMVVLDKKKEISVIKAMGASDEMILFTFLFQGGIIGTLGTTLGLLLGWFVCKGLIVYAFPLDPKVYFISHLPVQARPQEFLITGVVALLICLVATVFPALYAARLRPAEGFRDR